MTKRQRRQRMATQRSFPGKLLLYRLQQENINKGENPRGRMSVHTAIFVGLLLSLSARFEVASALGTDISCLKSLKDSLLDPFGSLTTWDFTNVTEGFICRFNGIECWHPSENKVLNIRLSNMGLIGHFPAGLSYCTALTGLDLSYNQLSGPIPSDIHLTLPYILSLDLSNNQFSGNIPSSIAKCMFLNSLSLDSNELQGPIPEEISLLPRIKKLNVSYNMLSGPVPSFPEDADVDYTNNAGLCGHPLKACKRRSDHSGMSPFIRGLLTGWGVAMSLVFFVCLYAIPERYVKKLLPAKDEKKKKKRRRIISPSIRPPQQNIMKNTFRMVEMEKYISRIPFADLNEATCNFCEENLIGTGRRGKTYIATIQNGSPLAVKWLLESQEQDNHIASETSTLGRLRHHKLVPLIGFCLEKNDTFLVYKHMQNGNLHDWLHLREGEGEIMRSWPLRFKIAVGVAEGLVWLHHTSSLSVIHGAISSKCILLDTKFEPKISNFWDAKFSRSDRATSCTGVYPRTNFHKPEGYKKDVYQFGVMLLELIARKNPKQLARFIRNISPGSLSLAIEVDETLRGQGFDDEILECLEIAHKCVQHNPSQRPTMIQVYTALIG